MPITANLISLFIRQLLLKSGSAPTERDLFRFYELPTCNPYGVMLIANNGREDCWIIYFRYPHLGDVLSGSRSRAKGVK